MTDLPAIQEILPWVWQLLTEHAWAWGGVLLVAVAYYIGRRAVARPVDAHPVLDHIDEAVLGLTSEGTVLAWNPQALEALQCGAAEIKGRRLRDLFPDSEQGIIGRILGKVAVGAEGEETTVLLASGEGTRRFVLRCFADRQLRPSPIAVWLIFRSEREVDHLRRTVKAHEDMEQLAADTGDVHTARWDLVSGDVEVGSSFLALSGLPESSRAMPAAQWLQCFDARDLPAMKATLSDLLDGRVGTAIADVRVPGPQSSAHSLRLHARVARYGDRREPLALLIVMIHTETSHETLTGGPDSCPVYREIFERMAAGVVTVDAMGRYTAVNRAMADLLGHDVESLLGLTIADVTHPDDLQGCLDYVREVIENGREEPLVIEKRYLHRAGHVLHAEVRAAPIRDATGRAVSCVATVTDITDRRQAAEAVAESRERLEIALDATQLGVWEWSDSRNAMVYVSDTCRRLFELDDDEPCTWNTWRDRIDPSRRNDFLDSLRPLLSGEVDCLEGEFPMVSRGGGPRWLRVRARARGAWQQGDGRRIIGTCQDITMMKIADETIRQSEQHYRGMYETSLMGFYRMTPGGRVVTCNPVFARLLGYASPEDCIDAVDRLFQQHAMMSDEQTADLLAEITLQGSVAGHELQLRDQTGKIISVSLTARATYAADGDLLHLDGTIEDITPRKLTEEKLLQATKQAEAASLAKTQFLANMSHEIRTPMTAILGYVDLLRQESLEDGRRREFLDIIDRNGKHLLELINDILDLSKIEAGRLQLQAAECSLPELLADVVRSVDIRAREKNVQFSVRFRNPAPERFIADAYRLRQVLFNLAGNAVKFTQNGTITLEVAADDHDTAERVWLEMAVEDTGIGIEPSRLTRIFEPFTQADCSTSRQHGGTGLGLSIVSRIVEQMAGRIEVSSRVGIGSRFTIRIPVALEPNTPRIDRMPSNFPVEPTPADDRPGASLSGLRILVAEDGLDNQRLICTLLRNAGATVNLAENGKLVLDQAEAEPPDLIVMDMQMPILDGYEATRRLRRNGYRGPIVALTAHAMAHDAEKCIEAGCDEYLRKPIDRVAFIATLRRLGRRANTTLSMADAAR